MGSQVDSGPLRPRENEAPSEPNLDAGTESAGAFTQPLPVCVLLCLRRPRIGAQEPSESHA